MTNANRPSTALDKEAQTKEAQGVLRLIPSDAERGIIACALLDQGIAQEYSQVHICEDFGDKRHRHIWRVIQGMVSRGEEIDFTQFLSAVGGVTSAAPYGGAIYLTELFDAVSSTRMAALYSQSVKRYALLRRVAFAGNAIARDAECLDNVTDESVATIISDAEETVFGFSSSQAHETGSDIGTLIAEWRQEIADHEINPNGMYGISSRRGSAGRPGSCWWTTSSSCGLRAKARG